uniref:Uncharacterized protein n=1 Tax=Anguilla anguilla TaxID=7936 RepID=A0A0E9PMD4_ANGAN
MFTLNSSPESLSNWVSQERLNQVYYNSQSCLNRPFITL